MSIARRSPDPVLVREDGTYLYTLPSVADDGDLGISHVIRGEDHVTNTAVQIQIFEALGFEPPAFGHHNLLTTAGGEGLSKRLGALSLKSLRESGLEPMAVASLAVLVGSAEAVRPVGSLDELAGLVDLAHISRAPAKFDEAELDHLNARFVHDMPYAAVRERLADLGIGGGEAFWDAVRPNLTRVSEAASWWPVITGPVMPVIHEPGIIARAAELLPRGALERGDVQGLDRLGPRGDGRKGSRPVSPAAARLNGARPWPRVGPAAPTDRTGQGPRQARGPLGLRSTPGRNARTCEIWLRPRLASQGRPVSPAATARRNSPR